MTFPRSKLALVLAAIALAAGALALLREPAPTPQRERPQLGLMTTLPIYWGEAESVDELLQAQAASHWARSALEQRYRLVPLDTLESGGGLADLDLLVLAQPRALSPQENVALDGWVRGGGRLLLFADPMLSGESRFRFGDRRRPQDVALLSPILARWELELTFDETQDDAPRFVAVGTASVPVRLAGSWRAGGQDCELSAGALIARCRIGAGQVLAIADAAMLEEGHDGESHPEALDRLTQIAFDSQ